MATTADDDESFLVRLEAMSLASLRDEWRRRWGPRCCQFNAKGAPPRRRQAIGREGVL